MRFAIVDPRRSNKLSLRARSDPARCGLRGNARPAGRRASLLCACASRSPPSCAAAKKTQAHPVHDVDVLVVGGARLGKFSRLHSLDQTGLHPLVLEARIEHLGGDDHAALADAHAHLDLPLGYVGEGLVAVDHRRSHGLDGSPNEAKRKGRAHRLRDSRLSRTGSYSLPAASDGKNTTPSEDLRTASRTCRSACDWVAVLTPPLEVVREALHANGLPPKTGGARGSTGTRKNGVRFALARARRRVVSCEAMGAVYHAPRPRPRTKASGDGERTRRRRAPPFAPLFRTMRARCRISSKRLFTTFTSSSARRWSTLGAGTCRSSTRASSRSTPPCARPSASSMSHTWARSTFSVKEPWPRCKSSSPTTAASSKMGARSTPAAVTPTAASSTTASSTASVRALSHRRQRLEHRKRRRLLPRARRRVVRHPKPQC